VQAVEGSGNVRSPAYHQLLLELITEAERNAHKPQQRRIFMACLARLLPCVGLYVLRHMASLMPLLLEWSHAYDEASVLAAVQLLGCVVRHSWPRVGVHAALMWRHLVEVVRAAEERRWLEVGRQEGDQSNAVNSNAEQHSSSSSMKVGVCGFESSVLVGAVLDVVGLLVRCGGEGFAAAVAATSAAAELEEAGDQVSSNWVEMLVARAREMQRAFA
jgi:hypothetical protein